MHPLYAFIGYFAALTLVAGISGWVEHTYANKDRT